MSATARYLVAALGLAGALLLLSWPFLDGDGRRGVLAALGLALPLQVAFFGFLAGSWSRPGRFFVAWIAGILGRLALLGLVALVVILRVDVPPAPTLLTLVVLLFGLLLLEPFFLGRDRVHGRER